MQRNLTSTARVISVIETAFCIARVSEDLLTRHRFFSPQKGTTIGLVLFIRFEVSQIARSIARPLGLNEDLTEAIALGHDLGHTPFGHIGEERRFSHAISLYRGMDPDAPENERIFAHNQQSARIVEYLEKDGQGLNLSHEVIDGY